MEKENTIGSLILDCAYRVHTELGPGLLENTYETCLEYELLQAGLTVKRLLGLPVFYKPVKVDLGYRIDLMINDLVILEIKSVDAINDVHLSQVLTYLKLSGCKLGYILNFNVKSMKAGIRRVILTPGKPNE